MPERRVTVVTGASSGIGRGLVPWLLDDGHIVVGASRTTADVHHERFVHHETDITDERSVRALCSFVRKEHGRFDHLVNCAGVAAMNHVLTTPRRSLDKVVATNLLGTYGVCQEAAKVMQRAKFGRIVNFTTVAVPLDLEGESAYVASKAAVEAMTRVFARELAPFGITLNTVGPTPVDTPLIAGVPADRIQDLIERQAIKRIGTIEDVRNVVDFFLRAESSFVTGQTIYLGGVS